MPRKLRVLVVEDYEDTRESLRRLLELWGHGVDAAADGEDGLRLANSGNYDVVVLDLRLPRLDGLEVGRQVAQKTPRPMLIAYSAFHGDGDRERTMHAGFDVHLSKGSLAATDELERILNDARTQLPDRIPSR